MVKSEQVIQMEFVSFSNRLHAPRSTIYSVTRNHEVYQPSLMVPLVVVSVENTPGMFSPYVGLLPLS